MFAVVAVLSNKRTLLSSMWIVSTCNVNGHLQETFSGTDSATRARKGSGVVTSRMDQAVLELTELRKGRSRGKSMEAGLSWEYSLC